MRNLDVDKSNETKSGGEGGRRIFEISFILGNNAKIVSASSSAEGSNER